MNTPANPSPERGKTLVLVLTMVTTVLVALVTALQVDASIRANQALRASQVYAVQVASDLVRFGAKSDYDLNTLAIQLTNSQSALVAEYSALQRQAAGDQQGYETLLRQSQVAQARADRARSLSVLMTDPAYAPASDQEAPDMNAYLADQQASSVELVQKQNEASDAYHRWSNKSDSYVAVLTVLAVAFFLLGVAQMTRPGLRLLFSSFAIAVIGIGILWCLILLLF